MANQEDKQSIMTEDERMDKNQFIIKILDLYWINKEKDAPDDLCLHGDVQVRIGEEVVADRYPCTVSSTALYLLKSLEDNHIVEESSNQMLPCCGFFIVPNDNDDNVEIIGCSTGIDWGILHFGDYIKLITLKGNEVMINSSLYQEIVYNFVDEVYNLYKNSTQKNLPEDDFDRDGYMKFWKEWNTRRKKGYSG